METLDTILTRRSVRKFSGVPVPEEEMEDLLRAAMSAPSAGGGEPWHFIVITERRILEDIPKWHPHAEMLKTAPAAVVVCGDLSLEKYRGHWVQDCSAATENILLAAHGKGLGAVWIGVYPVEDRVRHAKELLWLPENVIPLSIVAVGYASEEEEEAPSRFDRRRVHLNRW